MVDLAAKKLYGEARTLKTEVMNQIITIAVLGVMLTLGLAITIINNIRMRATLQFFYFCFEDSPGPLCGPKIQKIRPETLKKYQFVFSVYLRKIINLKSFEDLESVLRSINSISKPVQKEFVEQAFNHVIFSSPENLLAELYVKGFIMSLKKGADLKYLSLDNIVSNLLKTPTDKRGRFFNDLDCRFGNILACHPELKSVLMTEEENVKRSLKIFEV